MADPTKEELAARAKQQADADAAARAKSEADAKARTAQAPASAPAPAQPAAADPNTTSTFVALAEAIKRITPAGASHATAGLDTTQPGGFYVVNGVKVNAHGRELNDDGSLKYPEQQRVNEFGQLV
jgi:hypothetical protein